jgi:hypothetical protein
MRGPLIGPAAPQPRTPPVPLLPPRAAATVLEAAAGDTRRRATPARQNQPRPNPTSRDALKQHRHPPAAWACGKQTDYYAKVTTECAPASCNAAQRNLGGSLLVLDTKSYGAKGCQVGGAGAGAVLIAQPPQGGGDLVVAVVSNAAAQCRQHWAERAGRSHQRGLPSRASWRQGAWRRQAGAGRPAQARRRGTAIESPLKRHSTPRPPPSPTPPQGCNPSIPSTCCKECEDTDDCNAWVVCTNPVSRAPTNCSSGQASSGLHLTPPHLACARHWLMAWLGPRKRQPGPPLTASRASKPPARNRMAAAAAARHT